MKILILDTYYESFLKNVYKKNVSLKNKCYEEQKNYDVAIKNSHSTIGRAMFYTSLTIVLGFMILVTSNFNPSVFFGIFTSLSMIMAIIGSLFLLPVLLTKLKAMN